jgi:hypothetical protein
MFALIVTLFIAEWATLGLTLFDVGRYSFSLINVAAIPFWLKFRPGSAGVLVLPIISGMFAVVVWVGTRIVTYAGYQMVARVKALTVQTMDWA